jgi:hypothetical protein
MDDKTKIGDWIDGLKQPDLTRETTAGLQDAG